MILLKSCPRCRGDLVREHLPGEAELVCLQCGYRTDVRSQTPLPLTRVRIAGKAA
jgi:ribosomal protein S27AE